MTLPTWSRGRRAPPCTRGSDTRPWATCLTGRCASQGDKSGSVRPRFLPSAVLFTECVRLANVGALTLHTCPGPSQGSSGPPDGLRAGGLMPSLQFYGGGNNTARAVAGANVSWGVSQSDIGGLAVSRASCGSSQAGVWAPREFPAVRSQTREAQPADHRLSPSSAARGPADTPVARALGPSPGAVHFWQGVGSSLRGTQIKGALLFLPRPPAASPHSPLTAGFSGPLTLNPMGSSDSGGP